MQVVSLNHTREERGLLGAYDVQWTSALRRPERSRDPSRVGAGEISAGTAPRERRGGSCVQNREMKDGGVNWVRWALFVEYCII